MIPLFIGRVLVASFFCEAEEVSEPWERRYRHSLLEANSRFKICASKLSWTIKILELQSTTKKSCEGIWATIQANTLWTVQNCSNLYDVFGNITCIFCQPPLLLLNVSSTRGVTENDFKLFFLGGGMNYSTKLILNACEAICPLHMILAWIVVI
jgi:hypothetical protein